MSYKPQTKRGQGSFGGPSGIATIALNKDRSKVKVTIKSKEGEESSYILTEFPQYLENGTWYVRLNQDKDKFLSAYPANGMLTVKVNKFPAPEGEEPTPKLKEANYEGKAYSYQQFTVLLDVVSPEKLKGVTLPLTLRYHFDEMTEEIKGKPEQVVAYSHPNSKYTSLLMDFCDAVGFWDKGPMPFKPNILPAMQRRVLANDRKFQVVIKDGWVVTIFAIDNPDEDTKEEESAFAPDVEEAPF